MTTKDFVEKYYPFAKASEDSTGLSAVATLTQAALETGWGEHSPGNMFFGIKADKSWTGKKQLLITFEYFKDDKQDYRFILPKEVLSKKYIESKKKWLYKVRDYFRAYDSPYECFIDRYQFFVKNTRYKDALIVKSDYNRFFEEIYEAGYATAPGYADTLKGVAKKIIQYVPK